MIYFVQRHSDKAIKIGTSVRLTTRLVQLIAEHGDQLLVLGVHEGGRPEEQQLHARWPEHRVEGEWFRPSQVILEYIRAHALPWNGQDEVPMGTFKIAADILQKAKHIALARGITVGAYISETVRDLVHRDFERTLKKLQEGKEE